MTLLRRQGYPTPVCWDLDVYNRTQICDVNGYYALLGLVDRGEVRADLTCHDIAKIARRCLYEYHPDRGQFDADVWQKLTAARKCLTDDNRRFFYDNLAPNLRLLDESMRSMLIETEPAYPRAEVMDGEYPCFYYEGEYPHWIESAKWMAVVSYALWLAGYAGPLRLALSDRWVYKHYNWGAVLFVNRHDMDWDKIAMFVAREYCEPWSLHWARIAVSGGQHFEQILAQFDVHTA